MTLHFSDAGLIRPKSKGAGLLLVGLGGNSTGKRDRCGAGGGSKNEFLVVRANLPSSSSNDLWNDGTGGGVRRPESSKENGTFGRALSREVKRMATACLLVRGASAGSASASANVTLRRFSAEELFFKILVLDMRSGAGFSIGESETVFLLRSIGEVSMKAQRFRGILGVGSASAMPLFESVNAWMVFGGTIGFSTWWNRNLSSSGLRVVSTSLVAQVGRMPGVMGDSPKRV